MGFIIWTVGHSTRSFDEFLALLQAHHIQTLIDVRRFLASRRHPHFNREPLAVDLAAATIRYHAMPELGGRRLPRPDSRNIGWRDLSFRGYADYMETADFQQAIEQVAVIAMDERAALLCAEAVWWRCHRSLIADYLKVRNVEVFHIMDAQRTQPHRYTSAARLIDGALAYCSGELNLFPEEEKK